MVKSTTLVDMWPSSMVTKRMKAKQPDSIAVPGFLHHCLVTFSVSIPSKPNQHSGDIARLKRTAHFASNLGTIITECCIVENVSIAHAQLNQQWNQDEVFLSSGYPSITG